jgi:ABC-type nitrate/sulfonate/bicarbonate transport system substrate-binding protein
MNDLVFCKSKIAANARAALALSAIEGIYSITNLQSVGSPTISYGIATEQYLTEHQDTVEKYLKAVQEVYDFIERYPQEAAEIVQKSSGAPVEQVLINLKNSVSYIDFGRKHFEALQNLYQWTEANGIIKYPFDVRNYINVLALKKAFPGKGDY